MSPIPQIGKGTVTGLRNLHKAGYLPSDELPGIRLKNSSYWGSVGMGKRNREQPLFLSLKGDSQRHHSPLTGANPATSGLRGPPAQSRGCWHSRSTVLAGEGSPEAHKVRSHKRDKIKREPRIQAQWRTIHNNVHTEVGVGQRGPGWQRLMCTSRAEAKLVFVCYTKKILSTGALLIYIMGGCLWLLHKAEGLSIQKFISCYTYAYV